uniref:DUF1499 domain-containing protein n=1 Tax=Rhizochromulina marina TaxID=1034831 RepID=A0A7S2S9B5_9STRA
MALAVTCLGSMDAAEAFPNAMPEAAKFSDRPKKRGPEPKDIGLSVRSLNMEGDLSDGPVLKGCKSSPNCFSTSGDPQFDVPSLITPWKPPATQSKEATVAQLLKTIESYPPGQQGVDGGGFKVVKSKEGYIYTQFESLKNGYIDDVEFAVAEDGSEVQVRSSSRLGYLDFLVNAKRLNWFADALRADGWAAGAITSKSHPDYFQQNAQY